MFVNINNFNVDFEDDNLFTIISEEQFHFYNAINFYGLNHLNLFRVIYVELMDKLKNDNLFENKKISLYGVNLEGERFEISSYIYFDPYITFEEFYSDIITEFTSNTSVWVVQLDSLYKVEIHINNLKTLNN